MFAKLRGVAEDIAGNTVTLDVNGVGYEVFCSSACIDALHIGQIATLVIFTDVKEDSIKLFGFSDALEKKVFLLLTMTKGVGTKTAMDIVSRVDKVDLLKIIGAGDLARLQAVKGIGKKTAERIVVELKDKVASFALESSTSSRNFNVEVSVYAPNDEACQALMALGFQRAVAESAVAKAISKATNLTDASMIVREALRYI